MVGSTFQNMLVNKVKFPLFDIDGTLIEILNIHGVSEEISKSKINEATISMTEYFEKNKDNGKFILLQGVKEILKVLHEKMVSILLFLPPPIFRSRCFFRFDSNSL